MAGIDTFARVAREIRRDVRAARDRDPAARGVGPAEILATWPGIHALLAYRVAHALYGAGVPLLPRSISMLMRAVTGIDHARANALRQKLRRAGRAVPQDNQIRVIRFQNFRGVLERFTFR